MKIAAFLGSFDPPHLAHYLIAEKALEDGMDRVYFIPAKQNPWKKSQPASFDHRVKMLEFYTLGEPRFLVSRIEEEVESFYSYDVLRAFKEKFQEENEFYLLCGTDVAMGIGSWYRGEDILKEWKILESFRPTKKMKRLIQEFVCLVQKLGKVLKIIFVLFHGFYQINTIIL